MSTLPRPDCHLGYTDSQLKEILGGRLDEFHNFMRGQTVAMCSGQEYDHASKGYRDTDCGPHGVVTYSVDVERFVDGGSPLD